MRRLLNKLGLYTKKDLIQAFKNGAISEQNKMYIINQSQLKFVVPKKGWQKGTGK